MRKPHVPNYYAPISYVLCIFCLQYAAVYCLSATTFGSLLLFLDLKTEANERSGRSSTLCSTEVGFEEL